MLTEFRHKAYIGIAVGFVLIIVGRVVLRSDARFTIFGMGALFAVFAGWALFTWGCCHYAKAKGHSGWWGFLGLLSIVGLLILFSFPDRGRESVTHDMPSRGFLRSLIIAEIGLGVIGVVVSLLTESLLPEPLRAFVEAEAEADISTREIVMLATAIPGIILFVVSSIGLYFFWRPARTLYVITIVFGLLWTPFFGPYVDAGWGTVFEEATIIISGIILALIYFSPLKDYFDKPKVTA